MVSSTILTLVVIPAIYSLWREWEVRRAAEGARRDGIATSLPAADAVPSHA
jgi:hypothetical protein